MSDDDNDLMKSLATLKPIAGPDAAAIAYAVGRRSARASVIRWRAATTLVATIAMMIPLIRHNAVPSTSAVEPLTLSTAPVESPHNAVPYPPLTSDLVVLRSALLDRGLEGLPPPPRIERSRDDELRVSDLLGGRL